MRLIVPLTLCLFFLHSCSKNSPDSSGQTLTNLQNVQYAAAPDTNGVQQLLLMDIFFPSGAGTDTKYPLVLFIHGGAFVEGKKEDVSNHCRILADSGFVAATINY